MSEQELYPGQSAEQARRQRRHAAIEAAKPNPLPGPLAEVFAGVPEEVAGLTVRRLVHYDFVILKQLESPFLAVLAGQVTTQYTEEQGYELVWQFTRPIREVARVVKLGREAVAAEALREIGMEVSPPDLPVLVKAVVREFIRTFITVVSYEPQAAGAEGTVFTPPPAGQMTGSAGGSNITAGC
jgi:hypothetical protein